MSDGNSYLQFETCFSKHSEAPEILDFSVVLRRYSMDSDIPGAAFAQLKGFLAQPGCIPEADDEWYFDVFDMRSQHAITAFHIITNERPLLRKALKTEVSLDELTAVAHLERVWVNSSLRGRGIALRLMREAHQVLGRYGLLVILKAHPDGEDVRDADCLKLAAYYQSEKQLKLHHVSKKKHPGWLVAVWNDPTVHPDDDVYLDVDIKPSADEMDPEGQ